MQLAAERLCLCSHSVRYWLPPFLSLSWFVSGAQLLSRFELEGVL